jgi:hypothetical protein
MQKSVSVILIAAWVAVVDHRLPLKKLCMLKMKSRTQIDHHE